MANSQNLTTSRVLSRLREGGDGYVSGDAICRGLGISRAAVWKQIESLRRLGYDIDARPHRGYRLTASPNTPLADEVAPLLRTQRFGRNLHFHASLASTSRTLADLSAAGAAEGTVVVADRQTDGQGRMARRWFSPAGVNLYVSILLRPAVEPSAAATLSLLAGWAVALALEELAPGLAPRTKWPNDVLAGGRKLCGILCEMDAEMDRVRHVIVGIGVNVNLQRADLPADLKATATSLRAATGREWSRPAVLAAILNRFEPAYDRWQREGLGPFLVDLRARDALAGRRVRVAQAGQTLTGRAAGIAPDGALLLGQADGRVLPVSSGDAHVLRG